MIIYFSVYLFVFGVYWVFTAAQLFISCRRGLLPIVGLLSIMGAGSCSPSWGVSAAALNHGVGGRLLSIAGC